MSESGRSELLGDAEAAQAFEALKRRAEAANRVTKMRLRHDAVYAESKKRIPTPGQKHDEATLQRRVGGPFVDAMEEAEASRRREENVNRARVVLLSRLKLPKGTGTAIPRAAK